MNVDCDPYTKSPSHVPSNASLVSSSLPSPHVSSIVEVAVLRAIVRILPSLTVLSVRLTGWSPLRMLLLAPQSLRVRASCSHALLGAPPAACCCPGPLSFHLHSPTRPWSVTIHFLVMAMPLTSKSTLVLSLPLMVMSSAFESAVASITFRLQLQVFIHRPCLPCHVNILAWLVLRLRGSPLPLQVSMRRSCPLP
jgi:hypothetical protein